MDNTQPRGLDRSRVRQLLRKAGHISEVAERVCVVSAQLMGSPYLREPLQGSADSPEVFTASMKGFDCVTYIETVLALARSTTPQHFVDTLRRIRYANGDIEWLERNHYMTQWIRNNVRAGFVKPVSRLRAAVMKDRVLNTVHGLPARRSRFSCVPKHLMMRSRQLRTGDLVFFASTRPHLDVFHCGIVVNNTEGLFLRHASRSQGAVVEQPLSEFLKQNRMAGVLVLRPTEETRS
jgi:hypothetical protein